jgi:NADPH:quinone reductase-like Zn-dependent oxidoreductase
MSKTMHAVLLMGHGGFEQLEFRDDVPIPEPTPGEVLIRVGAAGVNNTDINTRTGWYSRSVTEGTTPEAGAAGLAGADPSDSGWTGALPQFPRIQGADACGTIVAVGAGVDRGRVGERVLIEPVFRLPGGPDRHRVVYFGSERDGAFAQFARVPAAHAHTIASALTDAELASFPCSYAAAENMLTRVNLAPGETVLITGASGGVGSAAVQLARRRGAIVIALAGGSKAGAVAALGAARVLERETPLLAALGRESVDVVVDVVGGAQFGGALDVLRRGGRYAVAGAIGGPVVPLDLRTLYLKDLSLSGCTVLDDGVFQRLVSYIERGEIMPVVAAVHPLKDIVLAQREFLQKRHTGKIVLIP